MKLTLVQPHLFWEDRHKNLDHLGSLMESINEPTDLILLPEMFSTGFTMNPEKNAEPSNGESLSWMKEQASKYKAVICGSLAVKDRGKYYNRLYWVSPDDEVNFYNKRHLFRMATEDAHYSVGKKKLITNLHQWKICPLICYDLRFPVWSRNRFKKTSDHEGEWDYDLLIYVANWPEVRNQVWKSLLPARAIENQCYVVGLNRVGEDGNGFNHSGDSVVLSPKGEVLLSLPPDKEKVLTIELDMTALKEFRNKFPVGLDADDFKIK